MAFSNRLVFAGTPAFAVPTLTALCAAGFAPVAVYTQPDRPAGRGRQVQPSPVKQAALAAGLPVEQPATLKDPDVQARLRAWAPELLIVVAYGLLLPPAVLALPRRGGVNLHASLLPRWRGAAPIQRALLAGDAQTGVDLMQMEAGLDTGPVHARREIPIGPRDTAGTLHDRLAALAADLLLEHLPALLAGTSMPRPQATEGVTYAHKIDKNEAWIDWRQPAARIERQIRAFDPWPVAQTRLAGAPLRLWAAELPPPASVGVPGQVLATSAAGIDVATGAGTLRLTRVQPPGKRPMSAAQFLAARSLEGARFE